MKYFILSTQRSGSDLLRHSLISLYGEHSDGPDEWIMHPVTRKNLKLPEDLEDATELILRNPKLLVDRMSPNTHRKVMYSHIIHPNNLPDNLPIIHLIRKDSWAQAKSYWIMKQKIVPAHVNEQEYREVIKNDIYLNINYQDVKKLAKKFYKQKQNWYYPLKKRSNTLLLYYEKDIANSEVFKKITLPKIEAFLNKKRTKEDYVFPLKKTSLLYTIKNLNLKKEIILTRKYYFKPSLKYWLKYKLKRILKI